MTESVKTRAPQERCSCRKTTRIALHSEAGSFGEESLAASGEAADSSRDKAALRNDNLQEVFAIRV
jgi:hypothetical protein